MPLHHGLRQPQRLGAKLEPGVVPELGRLRELVPHLGGPVTEPGRVADAGPKIGERSPELVCERCTHTARDIHARERHLTSVGGAQLPHAKPWVEVPRWLTVDPAAPRDLDRADVTLRAYPVPERGPKHEAAVLDGERDALSLHLIARGDDWRA